VDGYNPTGAQTNWAGGRGGDLEEEHDCREPECNDEGAQADDEASLVERL
jgi:hypothetical protein